MWKFRDRQGIGASAGAEITPSDGIQAAHEELYLRISAETFENVDAAVALIELLVPPVSGNPAAVSTTPTSVSEANVNVHNQSHKWFDGIDWKRMADSEGAPSQTSLVKALHAHLLTPIS